MNKILPIVVIEDVKNFLYFPTLVSKMVFGKLKLNKQKQKYIKKIKLFVNKKMSL